MQNSGLQIKKLILGVVVVGAFVVYSLSARHNSSSSSVSVNLSGSSGNTTATTPSSDPSSSSPSPSGNSSSSGLKDGTYTGTAEDAFYGNIQVGAVISGGQLTDVKILQYPHDNPHTQDVSNQSLPILKQEAIKSQSASVDIVTGATDTSQAFAQSLQTALSQAQS